MRRMSQAPFGAVTRSKPSSGRKVSRLAVTKGARATQEIHLAIGKEIGNALREAYRPCVFCVKYSNIRAPQAPSPDFVGSSLPEGALKIRLVLYIHYRQMPRFGLRIHHRWASHCVFKPFSDEDETKTGSVFVPRLCPSPPKRGRRFGFAENGDSRGRGQVRRMS